MKSILAHVLDSQPLPASSDAPPRFGSGPILLALFDVGRHWRGAQNRAIRLPYPPDDLTFHIKRLAIVTKGGSRSFEGSGIEVRNL